MRTVPIRPGRKAQVKCFSGYKADERPYCIQIGEKELTVAEIVDRWYEPGSSFFKLRAQDRRIYILKHDEQAEEWELFDL